MSSEFVGKRVMVTGAGQGIGRAVAIALAKDGAEVIAVSRSPEHLVTLKQEVPSIETVPLDICEWQATENMVRMSLPIDLLVNNAGVGSLESVGEITEDEFNRVFAVNVKAPMNIAQIVATDLKSRGVGGSIVNVSSKASIVALRDHTVYGASKAALDQMTKVMALELGPHQIRVNSVNPTVILTAMALPAWGNPEKADPVKKDIPLGRFAEVEDVVNAILFLLSSKSAMITGVCLPVDGGYTIH